MEKTFLNIIKNMMMRMMLNCRQASLLVDKQEYVELSTKEKMDLKMHLSTCKHCRNYSAQSKIINKTLAKVFKFNELELKLSDAQKQKLIKGTSTN